MRENATFIAASASLFVWMVFSSIEFGAPIFRLFPSLLKRREAVDGYMNPIWETTNVFLVFFIVSLYAFFPGANARFGTDLLMVVFPGLVFFGFRVLGVLLILYGGVRNKAVDAMTLLGGLLAPMTLSLVFVYMLTGAWAPSLGRPIFLALAGTVASAIALLSTTFFRWYGGERGNRRLDRLICASAAALAACYAAFSFAAYTDAPYLFALPGRTWILFACAAAPAFIFTLAHDTGRHGTAFGGACATVAGMFFPFVVFHLPYLIYPEVTVTGAFTNPAAFALMAGASAIGFALVIPGLILLYRMFALPPDGAGRTKREK